MKLDLMKRWPRLFVAGLLLSTTLPPPVFADPEPDYIITRHDRIPNFAKIPTHIAVQTGAWTTPGTWNTGTLPNQNSVVMIPAGVTVLYDAANGNAGAIGVHGVLQFATAFSTQLKVQNILVYSDGKFQIGTENAPLPESVSAKIIFIDASMDLIFDPQQYGNGYIGLGQTLIYGAPKTSFVRVAAEPRRGGTSLQLAEAPGGWQNGDDILIPESREVSASIFDGQELDDIPREDNVIQSVSGNSLSLQSPLANDHPGARDRFGNLVFLPHVANLSRNVEFVSENPNGTQPGFPQISTRGHFMVTEKDAVVDIRFARFRNMGRSKVNRIDNTTFNSDGSAVIGLNQKGRYSFHAHFVKGLATYPSYRVEGNTFDDDGLMSPFKWAITLHQTSYGLIRGNVMVNKAGAHLMQEDGPEIENVIEDNFMCRGWGIGGRPDDRRDYSGATTVPGTTLIARQRDPEFGFEGTLLWISNNRCQIRRNVGANMYENSGFIYMWFYPQFAEQPIQVARRPGADLSNPSDTESMDAHNEAFKYPFLNNEGYASHSGFQVWDLFMESASRITSTANPPESLIKDTTLWHMTKWGFYMYPVRRLTIDGLVMIGDRAQVLSGHNTASVAAATDYTTEYFKIIRLNAQNVSSGIAVCSKLVGVPGEPTNPNGDMWIEDSFIGSRNGIFIGTQWGVVGALDAIGKRTIHVKNTAFELIPTSFGPSTAIHFAAQENVGGGNYAASTKVHVTNHNKQAGNDFDVFAFEQAADQTNGRKGWIPKTQLVHGNDINEYVGCDIPRDNPDPKVFEKVTNAECFAQTGKAQFGEITPCYNEQSDVHGYVCAANATGFPTVLVDPQHQTIEAGQRATFTIIAGGESPLSYQWHRDNAPISGATEAAYTTPATALSDSGAKFKCVVSNGQGSDTSEEAVLTVSPPTPPSITSQPQDEIGDEGGTATFSLQASGSSPLSYQWRKGGAPIAGATSASHTTPALTSADNGLKFDCVVTNVVGTATSREATLTVDATGTPRITQQPVHRSVRPGERATFTVAASGRALGYQWKRRINGSFQNIPGATQATYSLIATDADNNADFQCLVGNNSLQVLSDIVRLSVSANAPSGQRSTGVVTSRLKRVCSPRSACELLCLTDGGEASAKIFEANGGLVAEVWDMLAAAQCLEWDPVLKDGSSAASGVYFFKAKVSGETLTGKMVVKK